MKISFTHAPTRILAVLLVVLAVSAPRVAQADEPTAQVLFKAGREAMEKKDYATACPKFEAALKAFPGIGNGVLMNLALCNENLGKTASAWGQFKDALFAAKKAGDAGQENFAKQHVDALEPKLSKIIVK